MNIFPWWVRERRDEISAGRFHVSVVLRSLQPGLTVRQRLVHQPSPIRDDDDGKHEYKTPSERRVPIRNLEGAYGLNDTFSREIENDWSESLTQQKVVDIRLVDARIHMSTNVVEYLIPDSVVYGELRIVVILADCLLHPQCVQAHILSIY